MPQLLSYIFHFLQWRIQDFPQGGAPTPKIAIIFHIFAENCMKMKEFGSPGGGARPWCPPLDPPMSCNMKINAVLFSVYFKILISIFKILTDIFRLKQCVTSHRSDLFFTAISKKFLASLCSPYLLKSNNHRHNFFMKIPTKCKFQKHVITLKYQGIV